MAGLAHSACSHCPRHKAVLPSVRDSPEPLSSTNCAEPQGEGAWVEVASRTVRAVASAPPKVRNSCRAITLLLNLLMSRTTSASGSEVQLCQMPAPAGQTPERTWPSSSPPSCRQVCVSKRAAKSSPLAPGHSTGQVWAPQLSG